MHCLINAGVFNLRSQMIKKSGLERVGLSLLHKTVSSLTSPFYFFKHKVFFPPFNSLGL